VAGSCENGNEPLLPQNAEISRLAVELLVSQEEFCFMELTTDGHCAFLGYGTMQCAKHVPAS
jgi:hypothetical protein